MAGDWIKMRSNLWDDPRVARLVEETDQSEAAVVGGLYWLWATADQHSSDGLLVGMTTRTVDRKTGVPGLGKALVSIGWLIESADGVTVPRFDEHNGASAKTRAQTAKRVANHKSNGKLTQGALPDSGKTVSGALPREREEKEKEEKPTSTHTTNDQPKLGQDAADGGGADIVETSLAAQIVAMLKPFGVEVVLGNPLIARLAEDRVQVATVAAACQEAKRSKRGAAFGLAYIVSIIERLTREASALQVAGGSRPVAAGGQAAPPSARKPQGMDPKGTDESYEEYQARIDAAEQARRYREQAAPLLCQS